LVARGQGAGEGHAHGAPEEIEVGLRAGFGRLTITSELGDGASLFGDGGL
jgi:hypothetical protein